MVKSNYKAWHIRRDDFSDSWSEADKLRFFARYAILAPSGHNTQPWKLTTHKNSLTVSINKSHFLSADGSGLLSVEPYISIGTFLEVFSLAARGFGYAITVRLFSKEDQIAEISIKSKSAPEPHLLDAITARVSNRNPFQETPISQKSLGAITANNLSGVATTLVTGKHDMDFIAEQTENAVEAIMGNPHYRKELSKWVRINPTRKHDGMPGFTHGFGHLQSLVSRAAVRHLPKHGPQAKKSGALIRKSGALVIVCCTDNKKESFVNAGRLYSQICVLAQDSGLATSALGASVIHADTREEVKQYFKIKVRPIYILRLGQATTAARHSPRWPLEKVLSRAAS